jgi:hypothetical protein
MKTKATADDERRLKEIMSATTGATIDAACMLAVSAIAANALSYCEESGTDKTVAFGQLAARLAELALAAVHSERARHWDEANETADNILGTMGVKVKDV